MNWKRVISGVLAAAMLSALPVQLLASAEGAEAAAEVNTWEDLTSVESPEDSNTFYYNKNGYTFEKLSHPEKDVKVADGIVDYLGDGAVDVVTDPEAEGYNAGDRGQNYAWAAVGYGDWIYVGTCYAAIGNTLSLMKSSLGDEYDNKVLKATFDALYNGTFFLEEADGGKPKGVLVKINTKTGETKVLMSGTLNGHTPLFRNAIEYHGKLYFCGSVGGGGIGFLPSVWQVDPETDECKVVYAGLNSVQDYAAAYKEGISTGIRGMCVYQDQLVISNVTMDAATGKSSATLLISSDPEKGFTQIADSESLFNYPAYRYADSIYGGSIWDMVEYNNSLYVSICTGTLDNMPNKNTMQSFALVRGDRNADGTFTWTPVAGDQKKDGARYTFGIDPERTRSGAANLMVFNDYLYIGEYNDEEIPLEELMFSQDFGFLARNLEQSVNLYRMSIGSDGTEQMELVVGEPTEMFPAGGILCKRSGFGDYENQYFWQSKVFDGKLFLGTFDTSSLLEPLGQFTNGDLLHMSRDEWASQIGYLKVLLKLLLNQDKNGDGTLLAADADTDAAIDAAVDAVNEEADSPETFSLTDAQYDTLRQGIDDGAYAAAYSVSTLGSLRRLNSLLAKLTDLVETNDIAGFVDIYQQVCDLYSGISDKLPDSMKELYEMLVRITELENMKDLVICLNKLSTATRGFGLYTITSENGKLTLDTLTRDGFGDPFNHGLRAFAVNDEQGWMVIGTANPFMGTQLWRTTVDMTDPMDRFTDLDPNGWAYPSIEYCVRHGLMSGMSDTIFSPNTVTTRAQLVQVLYNLEGKPDVSDVAVPFTDAASGWYRDAVAWAYKTGVVDGMSPTTFAPNNTVTREQVAVILMRYLTKVCGVERTWTPDDLSGFADGGNVSGWARAGMADAVALGLFGGTQDSSGQVWLRPGAGTTRAETAALLQRMCTKVLGIG